MAITVDLDNIRTHEALALIVKALHTLQPEQTDELKEYCNLLEQISNRVKVLEIRSAQLLRLKDGYEA